MGDSELEIFSLRIKELRQSLGMTQKEFAEGLNITASALSAYEKNNINPSISIAKRIAEVYHVSIDWLCGLSEKKTNADSPEHMSDILNLLFVLQNNTICTINYQDDDFNTPSYADIRFSSEDEKDLVSFFESWKKMKELHDIRIIDNDVYNLWKEKELKAASEKPLTINTGFRKIPDDAIMDDES